MSKFLLIILMMVNTTSFAAVSKWVDDQGQVHYSDRAPSDAKAKTLPSASNTAATPSADDAAAPAAPTAAAPAAPKTLAEREAELKKSQKAKQEEADKAAKEQARADALKAACASAQQNLRTLQSGMRTVQIDANGGRSYMDDAQRQQGIERAQQDINTACK